jgi:hypothetical protein
MKENNIDVELNFNSRELIRDLLEDAADAAYLSFKQRVPTRRTKTKRLVKGRTKSAVRKQKRARRTAFGYEINIGVQRITKLREGEDPEYPLFVHGGTAGRRGRRGVSSLTRLTKSESIVKDLARRANLKNKEEGAPMGSMARIVPTTSPLLVFKSPFSSLKKGNAKGLIFAESVQGQFAQPYLPMVAKDTVKHIETKSLLDFRGNIGIS